MEIVTGLHPSNKSFAMQLKIIFQCFLFVVCANSLSAQTDLIPFRKGNLWGFSKPDKTIVIPCQYDEVHFFANHKALVRKGLKYGLINDAGKEIVPCQYYNPIEFHEGLAKVAKSNCTISGKLKTIDSLALKKGITQKTETHLCDYGFVNEDGEIVIPCIYPYASDFQEGHALVTVSGGHYEWSPVDAYARQYLEYIGKRGFINKKGIPIGPFDATTGMSYQLFKNGVAIFKKEDKWSMIDTQGTVIVPFKYNNLNTYDGKIYIVWLDNKQGVITKSGQEIVPPIYDAIYPMGSTMMVVKNQKCGLLDSLGKILLPCIYNGTFAFNKGLSAIMAQTTKYGFVNTKGEIVLPFRYDKAEPFQEGRARVQLGQNHVQIDTLGHYVGEPNQHYFTMYDGELWQLEDKTGKIILPADTQRIYIVNDRFALVIKNNLNGLFDMKKQQLVLPCAYSRIELRQDDSGKKEFFLLTQNHLLGLANAEGTPIAPCEYDEYSPLKIDSTNDLVQICKKEKFGCLNFRTGKIVIPCIYDRAFSWVKGQSIAQIKGKMGIIDSTGRILLPLEYHFPDDELSYSEGLAPVSKDDKLGFINTDLKVVIPFEYDPNDDSSFQNGLALVSKADSFGFINRQNQVIVPLQYAHAHGMDSIGAKRACIHTETHTQFIDSLGQPLTAWIQGDASPYRNQVSILEIAKDTQVLINLQGIPISKKYHRIMFLNDSVLCVENGKWGLMNIHGREIVPMIYEKINTCNAFFYSALKEGQKGFILKQNQKWVRSDEEPARLNNGFLVKMKVGTLTKHGLINWQGQELAPMAQSTITTMEQYFKIETNDGKTHWTQIMDEYGKIRLSGEYEKFIEYNYPMVGWVAVPNGHGGFNFERLKQFYFVQNKEGKVGLVNLASFEWIFPCVYDHLYKVKEGLYQLESKGIQYYGNENKTLYYEN
jgi:WG containing repeat